MALLMGVLMDLLDLGAKLCAKLYLSRHKNDRKISDLPIGIATTKTANLAAFFMATHGTLPYDARGAKASGVNNSRMLL